MCEYLDKLKIVANSFCIMDVKRLSDDLLNITKFKVGSGSHSNLHHYGTGGLIRHTYEVVNLCIVNTRALNLDSVIDPIELFFAALYHDAGKIYDYEENDKGEWVSTEHKRIIHHISRSGIMWSKQVELYPSLNKLYHDKVLHAILAHHGRREWGSPVAPKSRVAWMLHLCDGISARMDDCERIDLVKFDK